jgi:predicted ABC-type ATPase
MGLGVVIDTDAIARTLNPENPEQGNSAAAREAIQIAKECINQRISFCIETTLGGRGGALNHIRDAKKAGYEIHIFFLGLDKVEVNIERVEVRVMNGGHHIPEDTIRRRFVTSVDHLIENLNFFDELVVIDNSLINDSRTIITAKNGKVVWETKPLPEWSQRIREYLK